MSMEPLLHPLSDQEWLGEVGLRDEEQSTQGLGVAGADCKGVALPSAGGSQTVRITELDHKCPRVWP